MQADGELRTNGIEEGEGEYLAKQFIRLHSLMSFSGVSPSHDCRLVGNKPG